jgi:hypothetical protein
MNNTGWSRRWLGVSSRCQRFWYGHCIIAIVIRIRRREGGRGTLVYLQVSLGVLSLAMVITIPLHFLNRDGTRRSCGLCVSLLRVGCNGVSCSYNLWGFSFVSHQFLFAMAYEPVRYRLGLRVGKVGVGRIRWSPLLLLSLRWCLLPIRFMGSSLGF